MNIHWPVRIVCGGADGTNISVARRCGTKIRMTRSTRHGGPQQFCQLTDKITGYWVRWKDGQPPSKYRFKDSNPEVEKRKVNLSD